jgi:hypothetical protein
MQTGLFSRVGRLGPVILPFLLVVVGCGSGKDAMEKRLSSLQEEVTRLQNTNDRLAERMQALEIQGFAAHAAAKEEAKALGPEDTRVVRPPLKVVKVAPGDGPIRDEGAGPDAEATPEDSGEARPVLRDHGGPPTPAWAKRRAKPRSMGQNQSGTGARKNPQGT